MSLSPSKWVCVTSVGELLIGERVRITYHDALLNSSLVSMMVVETFKSSGNVTISPIPSGKKVLCHCTELSHEVIPITEEVGGREADVRTDVRADVRTDVRTEVRAEAAWNERPSLLSKSRSQCKRPPILAPFAKVDDEGVVASYRREARMAAAKEARAEARFARAGLASDTLAGGLLTIEQAASEFGIGRSNLWGYVKDGKIPHQRIPGLVAVRLRREDIATFQTPRLKDRTPRKENPIARP